MAPPLELTIGHLSSQNKQMFDDPVSTHDPVYHQIIVNTKLKHILTTNVWPRRACIGVARGAVGATVPPRAEKKSRRNLQAKFISAPQVHQVHPQGEQESIFKTFLLGEGGLEVH